MRILYLANATEVGSPLGYCPNYLYIEASLKQLGHEVKTIDESISQPEDVINELETGKYQLLLTEEGRLREDFEHDFENDSDIILGKFNKVADYCREKNIPVVPWLTNIFLSIMRREIQVHTNPIFKSKIVFSTDGGHDKEFKALGVNHRLLRQGIYQGEAYLGKPIYPIKAEIVFIGSVYENIWPYRKELVDFLKHTYQDRFEHLGARGDIRHDALNNLCATAKIIVGDSVYSPHYWSNRVYEILGRGGFFIHPRVAGLDKEFIYYKHLIPYDFGNFEQLKEIIDYYLVHDKERDKIRLAGFEYCKKHYTYLHRVKELMRVLQEEKII